MPVRCPAVTAAQEVLVLDVDEVLRLCIQVARLSGQGIWVAICVE